MTTNEQQKEVLETILKHPDTFCELGLPTINAGDAELVAAVAYVNDLLQKKQINQAEHELKAALALVEQNPHTGQKAKDYLYKLYQQIQNEYQ